MKNYQILGFIFLFFLLIVSISYADSVFVYSNHNETTGTSNLTTSKVITKPVVSTEKFSMQVGESKNFEGIDIIFNSIQNSIALITINNDELSISDGDSVDIDSLTRVSISIQQDNTIVVSVIHYGTSTSDNSSNENSVFVPSPSNPEQGNVSASEENSVFVPSNSQPNNQPENVSPSLPSQSPQNNVCSGCLKEGICLPFGTRLSMTYCSLNQNFETQKELEVSCDNSYECKSNECSNGACTNTAGLLQKIVNWLHSFFGFKS